MVAPPACGARPRKPPQSRGEEGRLDPEDGDLGVPCLRRRGDAGDQPAAADRDDQRVELRGGVQHLQCYGALPGDDPCIVEGMDEGQAFLHPQGLGEDRGLVDALALEDQPGT